MFHIILERILGLKFCLKPYPAIILDLYAFCLWVVMQKKIALKEIYPYNNIRRDINEDTITLKNETINIHIEYFIFFAKSDSFKFVITQSEFHTYCHDVSSIFCNELSIFRMIYSTSFTFDCSFFLYMCYVFLRTILKISIALFLH